MQYLFALLVLLMAGERQLDVDRTPDARPLVLSGVTVIDATGAAPRPHMAVVIDKGRLAEVGKVGTVVAPERARVLDASGKFLIPGLWDMHVHWYDEQSLPLFTVNGVTGVRVMFGFPLHLDWQRKLAEGKLIGPRLVIAGPVVDGASPVWPDSICASNELEGRHAVQSIRKAGYDLVKVYHLLSRSAYFGIAGEAKRQGLPFGGHVPISVSAMEASDAGQKTIEHLQGVALACSSREAELRRGLKAFVERGSVPDLALSLRFEVAATDSYDEEKAASLFARFVKNGTWHVPTLAVRQSHARLQETDSIRGERMRYMPTSLRTRWESRRRATFKKLGPEEFTNFKRSFRADLELVKAMHHAGVGILAGTDTGALDCFPGFSLHDELALLVQAGLTPMEALQSATRDPARCLGRSNDLGTIEHGKLADLLLLDANPLDDIRNTTKIAAVVVNGQLLTRTALDRKLKEIEAGSSAKKVTGPPGNYKKYP
jgi:imidazolonepropionase-like amidohydrolase